VTGIEIIIEDYFSEVRKILPKVKDFGQYFTK